MWSKKRRASDKLNLPTRFNCSNYLVRPILWKLIIVALTIHIVSGTSYDDGNDNDDDDDYYSFSDETDYDSEEEELVHEIIVDDWYSLIRYLVGLVLCMFALIGLYFHQFASYYFLKRYTRPRETERRVGRVVTCQPLLSSNTIDGGGKKKKKQKNKQKKNQNCEGVPIPTFRGEIPGHGLSVTDYVREEDLERRQNQSQPREGSDQEFYGYRMLVVYYVSKPRSRSLLCCNTSSEKHLSINCTESFSEMSCVTGIGDVDTTTELITTYRSRSLPSFGTDSTTEEKILQEKQDGNMDFMNRNTECEYYQWFHTSTRKTINSKIDLILLKGEPTSACTQDLLDTHLSEIGKAHEGERDMSCKSISLMGFSLVASVIVLSLVCFFEIQDIPNPEIQRPIGYTVLGGVVTGSMVSSYLFSKLLFEQYKQKVFLSAFMAPTAIADGGSVRNSIVSSCTDNIYY